jgi:hypothetical protein
LQYFIWVAPDCYQTDYEKKYQSWFYFRVRSLVQSQSVTFTVKNIKGQHKLFE